MDSLIRLQRYAGKYRTGSWHRGTRGRRQKIRNPEAYTLALKRLLPADIRQRQLEMRATGMRRKKTPAENATYWILKHLNLPFRSQVVIGRYIADFILTTRSVILEIDGSSHDGRERYDRARDKFLSDLGWNVIRVKNEHVSIEGLREQLRGPTMSPAYIKRRIEYARAIERDRIEQAARSALHRASKVETGSVITLPDCLSATRTATSGQESKQAAP